MDIRSDSEMFNVPYSLQQGTLHLLLSAWSIVAAGRAKGQSCSYFSTGTDGLTDSSLRSNLGSTFSSVRSCTI